MIKKILSLLLSCVMLFALVSCADNSTQKGSIIGTYSIKNTGEIIIIEVPNLGGVYDNIYDKDGVYVKFKNDKEDIIGIDGKKIAADDLKMGDTLNIEYDGKVYKKKGHNMLKAYKITVID